MLIETFKKRLLASLLAASLLLASTVLLAGCATDGKDGKDGLDGKDGKDGKNGSSWYSGEEAPDAASGAVGDFYYDVDDCDIYRKTEGGWTLISNIKGASGEDGVDGKDGTDGEDGLDGIAGLPGANGADGTNGSVWHTGTTAPAASLGVNGDFYYDTDDCDIYQKSEDVWTLISNIKGAVGETGAPGATGPAGETGAPGTAGTAGTPGEPGAAGAPGQDGVSAYLGYDGYIWNGTERTEFKATDAALGQGVVENTLGIEGTMSTYFPGAYVDLSETTLALMANYMPTAALTQYSESQVTEIKVIAETAGTLYIGTAKVSDIVSGTYAPASAAYTVSAGLNTIALDLTVADGETVVLGGNGSVSLYYAPALPVDDAAGNFILSGNTALSETDGAADTLALQVSAGFKVELPVFDTIRTTDLPGGLPTSTVNFSVAPFAYSDGSLFAGKTITKIGIPVSKVSAIDENQTFTLSVIKNDLSVGKALNVVREYTLKLPKDQLGTSTTVGKWIYVDLTELNITLADDESLAFSKNGDTVYWYYANGSANVTTNDAYTFLHTDGKKGTRYIYFDIYYQSYGGTLEDQLEALQERENIARLTEALSGKNLSILGDSISTYSGYSNNAGTNDTIGSNSVYYHGNDRGIYNVNDTWWMQTANETGMNLLVNNSYSGDRVTTRGQTRCVQLHDNTTADNEGGVEINPDVIAVYLGINDFIHSVTVADFETAYDTMIKNLTEKYTDADVFLFTHVPNGTHKRSTSELEAFNDIIRATAEKYGCTVVDLYEDSIITASTYPSLMSDGTLHPNTKGMDAITDCLIAALMEKYLAD